MKISLGTFTDTGADAKMDLEILKRSHLLVQAASGAGKSWAFRRLAEQLMPHVQVIILDPEGEYFTLREKFDIVIIGRDSDVPCKVGTAATMAEHLLTLGCHAVIDLSGLKKPEQREYVKLFLTFCTEVPRGPLWHDMVCMVDEAHRFCPEKDQACSTEAMIDFTTLGRKRGYTCIYATQRISKLHKDAASELQNNLIGRTYLDIDRERAYEQLGIGRDKNVKLDFMQQMKMLDAGEFFALGRAIATERRLLKVGAVETTHIKPGVQKKVAAPPTASVLEILKKLPEMAKQSEEKKKTEQELHRALHAAHKDLMASKKAVEQLEQRIKLMNHEPATQDLKDMARLSEQNVALQNHIEDYGKKHTEFAKTMDGLVDRVAGEVAESIKGSLRKAFREILHALTPAPLKKFMKLPPKIVPEPAPSTKIPAAIPQRVRNVQNVTSVHNGESPLHAMPDLKGPQRKIIEALIEWRGIGIAAPSREQVAFMAGYAPSGGGFLNALGSLRTSGLVEYPSNGSVRVTAPAWEQLHSQGSAALDDKEIYDRIHAKLDGPQRKIFYHVYASYPEEISRDVLAEKSGYAPAGGGYLNALGSLRTLGLVEYPSNGMVKAREWMFV